jgi:ABC-type Fe3+-hydroxamate transport system substrate-binding protein
MPIVPTNETDLVDALGTVHEVASATARIVSLVPSITELLFDLGLATNVVGRTGFCIHPAELVKRVPKVGGTKSIDIGRLKRLAPTHIIVNIDENPRAAVEELARFVPHVIVTHPLAARDNTRLYRLLGRIFSREEAAHALINCFERAYQQTISAAAHWPRQ